MIDEDQEQSLTAVLYLATSPRHQAPKLPIYLKVDSSGTSKIKSTSSFGLYCSNQSAIWYKYNGFYLFFIDIKKENKKVPKCFNKSIINFFEEKLLLQR